MRVVITENVVGTAELNHGIEDEILKKISVCETLSRHYMQLASHLLRDSHAQSTQLIQNYLNVACRVCVNSRITIKGRIVVKFTQNIMNCLSKACM